MDDVQIADDIRKSMDDLDDLNCDGDSFGAKMVQWSNERLKICQNNGLKGGRPRKNITPSVDAHSGNAGNATSSRASGDNEHLDSSTDGTFSADEAPLPKRECEAPHRIPAKAEEPPSLDKLYCFAGIRQIPDTLAREWWEMCSDRDWCDRDGVVIANWRGALVNYAAARVAKLEKDAG